MHCAKCGAENRAGARFCDACGVALAEASSESSAPSAAGAIQVRVNLESAGAELPEGERKTVTALFADLKGSTELMRDLDPEEARAVIDPTLKLMMDAVHRYDGYGAPRRRGREALMGP
jgi:class 3 adenylate cyclase